MARQLTRSVRYRIEFDSSDEYCDVVYESETGEYFATVSVSEVSVRPAELDKLIMGLLKIRREIRAFEDATLSKPAVITHVK